MRIRVDLAYDGTNFAGWARQPGLRTVQAVVEDALSLLLRQAVGVTCAGRTDAGVHARGQVVHFEVSDDAWDRFGVSTNSDETASAVLVRRLGRLLPPDIAVIAAEVAPPGFHARFAALERTYKYRVCDGPPDPLTRGFVLWQPKGRLAVGAMARAAQPLLGLQDFAAFCRPREGATTIRTLLECSWQRVTLGRDAGLIVCTVRADAFCHSMVRSLVGACLEVGRGRQAEAWLGELLVGGKRLSPVAMAHGLTLEAVSYPPPGEMAARVTQTKARRAQ